MNNMGSQEKKQFDTLRRRHKETTAPPMTKSEVYHSPVLQDVDLENDNELDKAIIGINWQTMFNHMRTIEQSLPLVGELMNAIVAYRSYVLQQRENVLNLDRKVTDLEEKIRIMSQQQEALRPQAMGHLPLPSRFNTSFSSGLFGSELPHLTRYGVMDSSLSKPRLPSSLTAPEAYAGGQEFGYPPAFSECPNPNVHPFEHAGYRYSLSQIPSTQPPDLNQAKNDQNNQDNRDRVIVPQTQAGGQRLSEEELQQHKDLATTPIEVFPKFKAWLNSRP